MGFGVRPATDEQRLYCLRMKSITVGTAGHIDHGKTALVKALTGTDADRLEEEKRRGITIDIGFAHLELPAENGEIIRIGFIDVPGHERFVRNMLAGVGGIDFVLLVIAADESIKPQTREHFDICRLLSVRRGITVLTKSDLVDKETLDVVRLEVEEFVRGSFLDTTQSPIVAVSSRTGTGLEELKGHLGKLAIGVTPRDSTALPRLPIDRVFTVKGFGTVVTGTLISGTIRKDDELEVFPELRRVRVRGLQVHGQAAEQVVAGQRTAANLAGVSVEELKRGMVLSLPATFHPTKRLDVALSLLPSAKPLKHRARVRFHSHTTESVAEVLLYGGQTPAQGEDAYAQLRLSESTLLLPGDRFIVRQFSPAVTIGGGVVLDNAPPAGVKKAAAHLDFLHELKTKSQGDVLRARISAQGIGGLSISEAVARTGWTPAELNSIASSIPHVVRMDELLIATSALEEFRAAIISSLDAFHKQNPLVAGMNKEELRERLPTHPSVVLDRLLAEASGLKNIEAVGDLVRLTGRGVVLKDEEAESKRVIESVFAAAGLKVPALKDVLTGLKVDKARAHKIVTLLLRDKVLVKISEDLVFHSSTLDALRESLSDERKKSRTLDVARFKDLTGVSRKYAIPLLEYFDRQHVTRRVGDERVIL
jgi:selenocysteine-specific elongation factor